MVLFVHVRCSHPGSDPFAELHPNGHFHKHFGAAHCLSFGVLNPRAESAPERVRTRVEAEVGRKLKMTVLCAISVLQDPDEPAVLPAVM